MKYTFERLIKETLDKSDVPLTAKEIWHNAEKYGYTKELGSSGKTPWKTVEAKIYVDIKKQKEFGVESELIKVTSRPTKFGLRSKSYAQSVEVKSETKSESKYKTYNERDLHPLLSKFVFSDEHFKCYTKTIYHEKSGKKTKGRNKWLHPDIVGIYFPFEDYDSSTLSIIKSLNESAVKLFSFEMKKEIDFSNLREYYFQAVSNSSWANEGYLVAVKYSDEAEFTDEMQRLNNSFGIGFIKLNVEHVEQSEILLPAKIREKIDWETVNRLVEENEDFYKFAENIVKDIAVSDVRGQIYDTILDDDEYNTYLSKHSINSLGD